MYLLVDIRVEEIIVDVNIWLIGVCLIEFNLKVVDVIFWFFLLILLIKILIW